MKSNLVLPALLIATLTITPVFAQVQKGAFTASVFEGGYTFDGNQHLQTDVARGVRLGYNLEKNWGLEGQFTHVPLKSTLPVSNKGDQYSVRGDLLYHFLPTSNLVPFAVLGVGWSRTTNNYYYNDNDDATVDYGAGVKYFLTDKVALRGDIRNILSFHSSQYGAGSYWSNYEYTVGLAVQFGGSPAAPPTVAATEPAAVSVYQRAEADMGQSSGSQPERAGVQQPAAELLQSGQAAIPAPSPDPSAESSSAPAGAQKSAASQEQPAIAAESALAATATPQTVPLAAPLLPLAVVPASQLKEVPGDCSRCEVNTVCEVVVGPDSVEIISDLGIRNYKTFKLSSPTRLVTDICCATFGANGRSSKIDVYRMGLSTVRIGSHPGKMRVVLESPLAKFPDYQLEKTESGLNLLLK